MNKIKYVFGDIFLEIISKNYGKRVRKHWENASPKCRVASKMGRDRFLSLLNSLQWAPQRPRFFFRNLCDSVLETNEETIRTMKTYDDKIGKSPE